jgi:hypothetical protein
MENSFSLSNHAEIDRLKQSLLGHSIYAKVDNLERLRVFMQAHVFAVWDFMSLVKRLQRELTCVSLPWLPPGDRHAARMINEIIVAEESDMGPDGAPSSHLELYLAAMDEVGAETRQFRGFMQLVSNGVPVEQALQTSEVPRHVQAFVLNTLSVAMRGQTEEVMAAFFFGREDVIPGMFQRLLSSLQAHLRADNFVHYLGRHIVLDSGDHGPAAQRILLARVRADARSETLAIAAAKSAIRARIELFSQIELALPGPQPQ